MSLTQIAVVLVGAWLILEGAGVAVSDALTLIVGVLVVLLVVLDGRPVWGRRVP